MRKLSRWIKGILVATALMSFSSLAFAVAPGDVEIEVNKTPVENDDLVRLGATTLCRVRVKGNPSNNVTVVLTKTNSKLTFAGATTLTLTLDKNGAWSNDFTINGVAGSVNKDDVKIEAHKNTATGIVLGDEDVSVYYFDSSITVTAGTNYGIVNVTADSAYPPPPAGTSYTAYKPTAGGAAANFSAVGALKPTGLNCNNTEIEMLGIGIMQNVISATADVTWDQPFIQWLASSPPRTVWSSYNVVTNSTAGNDTSPLVAPLYDQPGTTQTIDSNSLQGACAGAPPATSNDSPQDIPPMEAKYFVGNLVGVVAWPHVTSANYNMSFRTWAVTYDTVTHGVIPLRETTWSLNVNSANANQRAVPATPAGGVVPVNSPSEIAFTSSATAGSGGTETTTFTHP